MNFGIHRQRENDESPVLKCIGSTCITSAMRIWRYAAVSSESAVWCHGVGHKRIQIHKVLQNNQAAQGIRLDALLDCRICSLQAAP